MSIKADVGLVLTHSGGHPVMIVSDYPAHGDDLVIMVNFTYYTNVQDADILFHKGYRLSGGYAFDKDSTVHPDVAKCTRSQAETVILACNNHGHASQIDIDKVRKLVAVNSAKIKDADVRSHVQSLGW